MQKKLVASTVKDKNSLKTNLSWNGIITKPYTSALWLYIF